MGSIQGSPFFPVRLCQPGSVVHKVPLPLLPLFHVQLLEVLLQLVMGCKISAADTTVMGPYLPANSTLILLGAWTENRASYDLAQCKFWRSTCSS